MSSTRFQGLQKGHYYSKRISYAILYYQALSDKFLKENVSLFDLETFFCSMNVKEKIKKEFAILALAHKEKFVVNIAKKILGKPIEFSYKKDLEKLKEFKKFSEEKLLNKIKDLEKREKIKIVEVRCEFTERTRSYPAEVKFRYFYENGFDWYFVLEDD